MLRRQPTRIARDVLLQFQFEALDQLLNLRAELPRRIADRHRRRSHRRRIDRAIALTIHSSKGPRL